MVNRQWSMVNYLHCKGTKNINTFPKIAKKLHHFNIRLHGILTFRYPSMCDIAMVDEYDPIST